VKDKLSKSEITDKPIYIVKIVNAICTGDDWSPIMGFTRSKEKAKSMETVSVGYEEVDYVNRKKIKDLDND
jgi:hypothetical protein